MAMQAGTLQYVISVDSSAVGKGLSSAESKVKGFGDKMSSWAIAKGQILGRLIEKAGQATLQFVKGSVQESMAFDKSMAQVAATLGKTTKEVTDLAKFARKMGSQTAFTAQEAAQGLNYMALAGYDAQTSMKMLPTVLNLAAAGAMGLADASDMVTDAQSALGLSIEQTETMVDQMAKTSSKTNTSVAQLGAAFLTVGGTAKKLKGGTQELSAMLGVLANNGIKGSEGGTALRNVLNGLGNPAGKAAKGLKQLNIEAYDASGNLRSLPEIFVEMNKAMSSKTMKERTELFAKMFNVRDLKSIEALLSMTADDWKTLMDEIGDSNGAASRMAETQLDNLTGDVTIFKSALGEAKLSIVEGLTPTLRRFVQIGTKLVQRLTKAFNEKGLSGAIKEAGTIFKNFANNLKNSDDKGLQKLGGALEWVYGVGSEVFGLITDFPAKLKEWQESDSPGLQALASLFGSLSDAISVVEAAFNGGLPAAIDKLKEIDSPVSNIAATGLEALKTFCEFVVGHSDLGGILEGIAIGFAAFKGIEISASLITFLSKLSSIKNAAQLGQLLKTLNNGGGDGAVPTTGGAGGGETGGTGTATGGKGGIAVWAKNGLRAFGAKAKSLWATAGGAWSLAPLAVLGMGIAPAEIAMAQTRKQWAQDYERRSNASQLPSNNAQFIKEANEALGTNGQVDWDKAEKLLMGLSKRENKEKAKLANMLRGTVTAGYDTWNLLNKFWNGADLDLGQKNELFQNITDIFADEAVTVQVDPDVNVGEVQAQLSSGNYSINVTPNVSGIFGKWFSHAKGAWDVPYDNYPALLHRDERVLTASQARRSGGIDEMSPADISAVVGATVSKVIEKTNILMSGEKVGNITTRQVRKNMNASSFARQRAYGG